jgi:hypothetical protein
MGYIWHVRLKRYPRRHERSPRNHFEELSTRSVLVAREAVSMTQFFVLVGLAVGVLAIATWLGTVQLKVAHPPTGDFVEVEGLRVHIAVLGLPPGALPSC